MTGQLTLDASPVDAGRAARAEERAARQQHRHMARMRAAADTAAARAWRARLAEHVRATRGTHPRCRCQLTGVRDAAALQALEGGCTMPGYACPRLDAIRRLMA